ncbi:hypothetical protein PHMEG_0005135 [Phytophthora megakarya]|uniref:Uncharacterized protein n=1 Tax=Phytophthora megakarya TaxID=4795 RepID=A0A225WS70_9STRA|nr:hypothetical protein PHMEG_0005135 [Phytophthora megakarya]
MNIYTPNIDRARDFLPKAFIVAIRNNEVNFAVNFNSVQSPRLDRLGRRNTGRPESAKL